MTWQVRTVLWLLLASSPCVADSPAEYRDPANKFRIKPPAFEPHETFGFTSQPVTFTGPWVEGKAPSCNVQVQIAGLPSARYRELSLNQFKSMGMTIDSEEATKVSGLEAHMLRYSGLGITAVALAVFLGERVYLVTCSAPKEKFDGYEKMFMETINSFVVEQ